MKLIMAYLSLIALYLIFIFPLFALNTAGAILEIFLVALTLSLPFFWVALLQCISYEMPSAIPNETQVPEVFLKAWD